MKFVVKNVSNFSSARRGTMKNLHREPNLSLETPGLFLYTKGGCVPHLTLDVLQSFITGPSVFHLPLPSSIICREPLAQFQHGIGNFMGIGDHLTYCTVQDPINPIPAGHNVLDKVSIWSRSGKEQLNADEYMDLMESFKPDIYQCLGDGSTNMDSTNKRIQKSIKRSLSMFHKCLQRHKNSEVLKKSAFIAILQGGFDLNERLKYAKEISTHPIDGFVIDGLHENNPEVEFLNFEKVKPLIPPILKEFSEDKLRIIHGCWNPDTVLKMVSLGIDIFDTTFPVAVSERGSALTFVVQSRTETCNTEISGTDIDLDKKCNNSVEDFSEKKHKYEISLLDKTYEEDFEPILKKCQCLCCKQYSRAYIHHLLCSKELLARVLLMIHNLHHYFEFFDTIRMGINNDCLHELQIISSGKIK